MGVMIGIVEKKMETTILDYSLNSLNGGCIRNYIGEHYRDY